MSKPKLLDLCCGVGGASRGYQQAGFDVTGVDIHAQPDYVGDEFIQADVMRVLDNTRFLRQFDYIHASFPCQRFTSLARGTNRNIESFSDLITPGRYKLDAARVPYILENVTSAPIRADLQLCGLEFDLPLYRHRNFEFSSYPWFVPTIEHISHKGHRVQGWRHGKKYDGDIFAVYGQGGGKGTLQEWQDAMQISWTGNRKSLAEAIPPAYTKFIGASIMARFA